MCERYEKRELLISRCHSSQQIMMNTWCEQHTRWIRTWQHSNRLRNQLDCNAINAQFRRCHLLARNYPGSDCESDHNPFVYILYVKFKNIVKCKQTTKQSFDNRNAEGKAGGECPRITIANFVDLDDVIKVLHVKRTFTSRFDTTIMWHCLWYFHGDCYAIFFMCATVLLYSDFLSFAVSPRSANWAALQQINDNDN